MGFNAAKGKEFTDIVKVAHVKSNSKLFHLKFWCSTISIVTMRKSSFQ